MMAVTVMRSAKERLRPYRIKGFRGVVSFELPGAKARLSPEDAVAFATSILVAADRANR